MRGALLLLSCSLAGCGTVAPRTVYISVPSAYLAACAIPAIPADNAQLSDAFAQAAQCAKQGNDDKAAIREHIARYGQPK